MRPPADWLRHPQHVPVYTIGVPPESAHLGSRSAPSLSMSFSLYRYARTVEKMFGSQEFSS